MARKPKLNLERGNAYTLKLLFDTPKEGKTGGRKWWMYSAEYEGQEVIFFAPNQQSHKALQETEAGEGDTITIDVDDDGDWNVTSGGIQGRTASPNPIDYSAPRQNGQMTWSDLVEGYQTCLVEAQRICEAEFEEYGNEDIRNIATTLYIQARQKGVEIPNE